MVKLLVALALFGGVGCTWFEDDPPDDSCSSTDDCFADETCDVDAKVCVPVDANP